MRRVRTHCGTTQLSAGTSPRLRRELAEFGARCGVDAGDDGVFVVDGDGIVQFAQAPSGELTQTLAGALEAPLSGRLCAYYSIEVLGRMRRPASDRRIRTYPASLARGADGLRHVVTNEDEAVPFELELDGQCAVIDPTDAWISSWFNHMTRAPHSRGQARRGPSSAQDWIRLGRTLVVMGSSGRLPESSTDESGQRLGLGIEVGLGDHRP